MCCVNLKLAARFNENSRTITESDRLCKFAVYFAGDGYGYGCDYGSDSDSESDSESKPGGRELYAAARGL